MSDRVTCANCGYLNEPGDEFCGDCGTYLAWSGSAETDQTSADAPPPPSAQQVPPPVPTAPPPAVQAAPKAQPAAPVPVPVPAPPPPVYAVPANPQPPGAPPPMQQQAAYGVMPPPQAPGVPCRNCGLMNPPGRSFCQRCGQKLDPSVGTMAGSPRPAPGPATAAGAAAASGGGTGKRLAIAGIAAVFIAAVAGIAVVLSGAFNANNAIPPTPPISALGSSTPAATGDPTVAPAVTAEPDPTDAPTPEPTVEPVVTAIPAPTEDVTPEPTVEPEPTPTRTPKPTKKPTPSPATPTKAPAPGAYVCDTESTIPDPLSEGWNLRRIEWANKGKYDRLIVTLDQRGTGRDGTQAIVRVMPLDEVPTTLKVSAPQAGDVAVALGLLEDVRLTWSLDRALTLSSMKWITMEKDDNGFPWIVLGVDGAACYSLQIPDWTADDPQPTTTVLVTIDVKH